MLYALIAVLFILFVLAPIGEYFAYRELKRERDEWREIAHRALEREDALKKQLGLGRHRDGPVKKFHAEDLPENFLG